MFRRSKQYTSLFSFMILAAGFPRCDTPGNIAAGDNGDTSHPLADRVRPDVDQVAACGVPALTADGRARLHRTPYLQQVTGDKAIVAFTVAPSSVTGAPIGAAGVEVSRPDGSDARTIEAAADTTPGADPMLRVARLDGLSPGAIYCYVVRGEDGAELVSRAGFRTAPAPGSDAPVRFVAFGDSGSGTADQSTVRQQIEAVPWDLLLVLGDIAYNDGTAQQLEDNFFTAYEPLLATLPAFPITGNHDYVTDDAAAFRAAFVLPTNGGPTGVERWYSYDWGDIHFAAIDTEKVSPEQVTWLDNDLKATKQPWKIVYGHKPPYSSGEHGSDDTVRSAFGPTLERNHVALALFGHDHDYERVQPQNGVHYVVSGGGGRGTKPVSQSAFTAFSTSVEHFLQVTIEKEQLTLHAIDGTGREFDSLVIPRPGADPATPPPAK